MVKNLPGFTEIIQGFLCCLIPLFGSFAIPFDCFCHIFTYANTLGVTYSEAVLGWVISLFGSFAIQFDRFVLIFTYAIAVAVAQPEIVLTSGISLFGSFAIPFDRFCHILPSAVAENSPIPPKIRYPILS